MALRDHDNQNFNTLRQAFINGDVCLAESRDKHGQYVALLCIVTRVGVDVIMTPVARLIDGGFEDYTPPDKIIEDEPYERYPAGSYDSDTDPREN